MQEGHQIMEATVVNPQEMDTLWNEIFLSLERNEICTIYPPVIIQSLLVRGFFSGKVYKYGFHMWMYV